jgi:hypothetical protein
LTEQLEHCDFGRFAPSEDRNVDLSETNERISMVLVRIDGALRPPEAKRQGKTSSLALSLLVSAVMMSAPSVSTAATLDAGFADANKRFVATDYDGAVSAYRTLLHHDVQSAAVHYNIGNAQVKLKRLGHAIAHYKQALRLQPESPLRVDIQHNLRLVRAMLAERARRQHRVLHVFDESPDLDVAVARAAPRSLLGVLVIALGFAACLLLGVLWLKPSVRRPTLLRVAIGLLTVGHLAAGSWLWHARHIDRTAHYSVVVVENAPLKSCIGVGESIDLPEGLEVRTNQLRPDGRIEVELPNGRTGCMAGETLYDGSASRHST